MLLFNRIRGFFALRAALVGILITGVAAGAQDVHFRLPVDGGVRMAVGEVIVQDEVSYTPIEPLATQLGAAVRVTSNFVQIDFRGQTAWISADGADVNASRTRFRLNHPLVEVDGRIAIAVVDVSPLFTRAFGVELSRRASEPESETPPEPLDEEGALFNPSLDTEDVGPSALAPMDEETLQRITGLKVETIVIDPGHDDRDPGGVSAAGLAEKDVSLAVAKRLQSWLDEQTDCTTHLTRTSDQPISTSRRLRIAQDHGADLLISLHTSVAFSSEAAGFHIFYAPLEPEPGGLRQIERNTRRNHAESARIAALVGESFGEATNATALGNHEMYCRVLSNVDMAGFVIELGYLSNPDEATELGSAGYQEAMAEGIARGIMRYMGRTDSATDTQ